MILPRYGDLSILNLPATLCRWLGVPEFGAPSLASDVLVALNGVTSNVDRVVLVLVDALSHQRLRDWMDGGSAPEWKWLLEEGYLIPLTSIVPSTTSAALTSLWTGRSASEHGCVGYELWLKEYGVVANMITHSAFSYRGDPGGLERADFSPEAFMSAPTLGPHLHSHGVDAHAFQPNRIAHSGLSRMFLRDVDIHGFVSPTDLWIGVRELLESHQGRKLYVWAYWDAVDTLSHLNGPESGRSRAEFAHFSQAMMRFFLEPLSPAARRGTLLVLLADHGQLATQKDPFYDVGNHPQLVRRLHLQPTGENRLAYLFVRPGQTEAVREYIERTWPNQFTVLHSAYAIDAGLFGSGETHPRLLDRLGDLIVVAREKAYWWWAPYENPIIGRHGGLSLEEMVVPLLVAPL
jgi:predicted AlkP superfamily pyrophosphatase or phosphodiesterase